MFVELSTMIDASISDVEKRFNDIRSGLDGDVIHLDGEDLVARVGPTAALTRDVRLDIGPGTIHNAGLVYPIHWAATSAEAMFPELDADLILTHCGRGQTQVTFKGTYHPPLGAFGRLVDRAVLGRVAEATVANLMESLAAALSSQSSET